MRAATFDPHNVDLLLTLPGQEYHVLVHEPDLSQVHRIPNLYQLKQRHIVHFVCYKDVMDVKHRRYVPIMAKGGIIIPDDNVLMTVSAGMHIVDKKY